ncbi:hypothetical protein Bca52824_003985 [Brassica carinata]|uniref:ribonuclease Z n=1 Tax=Brassica carinata TaxID=52824 RepID=A0A8X7WPT7_BRACI|nr:hypothetical protein Bca52824_003985 [Brassica carinata]
MTIANVDNEEEAYSDSGSVITGVVSIVDASDDDCAVETTKLVLPEEYEKNVMVLTCDSTVAGGSCDVYLIGTAHVSEDALVEEAVAKNHSTTKEAIDVGSSAGVYRIILTHFSQRYPKIPVIDESHMHNTCIYWFRHDEHKHGGFTCASKDCSLLQKPVQKRGGYLVPRFYKPVVLPGI